MACTRCRPDLLPRLSVSQRWILSKTKPLINCAQYTHGTLSTRQTARVTTQSPTQSIGLRPTIFLLAQDQLKGGCDAYPATAASSAPIHLSTPRTQLRAFTAGPSEERQRESRANWLHLTKITSSQQLGAEATIQATTSDTAECSPFPPGLILLGTARASCHQISFHFHFYFIRRSSLFLFL
jgi:hypothetical protein